MLFRSPEYVTLAEPHAPGAVPATVLQAQDIGTYWLITAQVGPGAAGAAAAAGPTTVRARLSPDANVPAAGAAVWLAVLGSHTCFYADDVLIGETPEPQKVST